MTSHIGTGGFRDFLVYLEDLHFFDYALPGLLIFALTFGILTKIKIFGDPQESKGVYAIISIAVGLLSLQFNYVTEFFARIFPYAGIGIGILLVAIIIMGLFGDLEDKKHWSTITFFILGAIIALWVILAALMDTRFGGLNWWNDYGPAIITIIIIGVLVGLVLGGGPKKGGG
jgi:hypothetical protein